MQCVELYKCENFQFSIKKNMSEEAKRNAKEFVHEFVALLLSLPIREY